MSYPRKIVSLRASFDKWWERFSETSYPHPRTGYTDKGVAWLAVQSLAEIARVWVMQRETDLGQIHVDEVAKELSKLATPVLVTQEPMSTWEARKAFELFYRRYRKFEPGQEELSMDQLLIRKDDGYLYGHPNSVWVGYKEALLTHGLIIKKDEVICNG